MAKGVYPESFDQYNRPPEASLGTDPGGPSMTKQEFAVDADLNTLMERYTVTGEVPVDKVGTYGDFSTGLDFMQAQQILLRAEEQFMAMDARVRTRFNNDPAAFLDFVHDPANLHECAELGLLNEEAVKRVQAPPAPAVPPAPKVPGGG